MICELIWVQGRSKLRMTGSGADGAESSKKLDRETPRMSAILERESMAMEDMPLSICDRNPMDSPDSSLSCFNVYFLLVLSAFNFDQMVRLWFMELPPVKL